MHDCCVMLCKRLKKSRSGFSEGIPSEGLLVSGFIVVVEIHHGHTEKVVLPSTEVSYVTDSSLSDSTCEISRCSRDDKLEVLILSITSYPLLYPMYCLHLEPAWLCPLSTSARIYTRSLSPYHGTPKSTIHACRGHCEGRLQYRHRGQKLYCPCLAHDLPRFP
jgi:hypothetical protein